MITALVRQWRRMFFLLRRDRLQDELARELSSIGLNEPPKNYVPVRSRRQRRFPAVSRWEISP